jgi:hypothetical protein
MPNWCDNIVKIKGPKDKLEAMAKAFIEAELLAHILPEPDYKKEIVLPTFPEISGNREPVDESEAWWDWRVQNWGTKWDVGGDDYDKPEIKDGVLSLRFSSAWSPPVGAYKALIDQGFEVEAFYWEPGEGFAGKYSADGDDFYRDDSDVTEEVDDVMGISECKEEWGSGE